MDLFRPSLAVMLNTLFTCKAKTNKHLCSAINKIPFVINNRLFAWLPPYATPHLDPFVSNGQAWRWFITYNRKSSQWGSEWLCASLKKSSEIINKASRPHRSLLRNHVQYDAINTRGQHRHRPEEGKKGGEEKINKHKRNNKPIKRRGEVRGSNLQGTHKGQSSEAQRTEGEEAWPGKRRAEWQNDECKGRKRRGTKESKVGCVWSEWKWDVYKNQAGNCAASQLRGWNEMMIRITGELIGMDKHASKHGMICVRPVANFPCMIRSLIALMKNDMQVFRWSTPILGMSCCLETSQSQLDPG